MQTILEIPTPAPFDFAGSAYSHGWVVLAPNVWHKEDQVLHRVERLNTGNVVLLSLSSAVAPKKRLVRIDVEHFSRLSKRDREEILQKVGHMLRFDEDLRPFYRECRRRGEPWKRVTKGLGRLLRSPTVFEDVVKTICTTNIQWGGTKRMVEGLVEAYGASQPKNLDHRAFPEAAAIAEVTPKRLAASVRMGYRAAYVHALAEQVASGALDLESLKDPELPTAEVKQRLLAIKGIGGYGAATMLMLLGHYDDLAVDSVCRAFVTKKYFRGKQPSDERIRRVYADWGAWKYLAFWFDVWEGHNEQV